MISEHQIATIAGTTVKDRDGNKIGKAGQVYLDDSTGQPAWVTVNTGLFGTSESFVPLQGCDLSGDTLTVPHTKDQVKDAPTMDADAHLDVEQEQELYRYYDLRDEIRSTDRFSVSDDDRSTDRLGDRSTPAGAGELSTDHGSRHDTRTDTGTARGAGIGTDDAMTRSEERLDVGTERVQTGKARLRKYVTTEQQQVTVPVSREEVRLEREPITGANRGDALDGPAISEAEHDVVLTEERPVVSKEAVPVERVRLDTDVVTEQETVSEQVRKEQIDLDQDAGTRAQRDR